MKKNDIVVVENTLSLPVSFLGIYGVVEGPAYEDKVFVKFNAGIGSQGSLTHTAYTTDLRKIGVVTDE